jgi:hypothetical protein
VGTPDGTVVYASPFTASARAEPVCPMAPAPFAPLRSTPLHCDTIHWQWDSVTLNVIVSGPLPGEGLMARKMVKRLWGMATLSKVMVATSVQTVIPPPDSVGLGAALVELCPMTATVTSALGAGAMAAVV